MPCHPDKILLLGFVCKLQLIILWNKDTMLMHNSASSCGGKKKNLREILSRLFAHSKHIWVPHSRLIKKPFIYFHQNFDD